MAVKLWVIFQSYSFSYDSLFFNLVWWSWGCERLQCCAYHKWWNFGGTLVWQIYLNSQTLICQLATFYIVYYLLCNKFAKPSFVILLWKAIHQTKVTPKFCHLRHNVFAHICLFDWLASNRTHSCYDVTNSLLTPGWYRVIREILYRCSTSLPSCIIIIAQNGTLTLPHTQACTLLCPTTIQDCNDFSSLFL